MKEQHKNPDEKNTDTQVSVLLSLSSSNCLAVLFALSLETEHVVVKSSKTQPLYCCFFLLLSLTIPSLPPSCEDTNSSKHMYCILPVDLHH